MDTAEFRQLIKQKGKELFRPMPWRENTSPYYVLVSELMLQQTQVDRVMPKFNEFIHHFPTIQSLAAADLADVLRLWQGLGYNRRAKYLHQTAQKVTTELSGVLPDNLDQLKSLPGIGPNTAAAIYAYAYNKPALFIETNIRTVYIHHFFADNFGIDDRQIRHLLEQTIDTQNPRAFYWALMDYGTYLKRSGVKAHTQSKHFVKQSKLEGSLRQMRGNILRSVSNGQSSGEIMQEYSADPRFESALAGLVRDGLVQYNGQEIALAK